MKVGWIAGWGIDPARLHDRVAAAFPQREHEVILPGKIEPGWPLLFDAVIGWSWGAYRLLEWCAEQGEFLATADKAKTPKLYFLSPFAAFCSEDQQGGRCLRAQVKWLRRWLKRDPEAALADFYQRAGLLNAQRQGEWAVPGRDAPHLAFWELELAAMETGSLVLPRGFLSPAEGGRARAWVGELDPLLDATVIAENLGATLVPGAGHNITEFFPFLTKELSHS